jgi:EAL domain-containing protein (putative c-di-GMP-specific phosphodiesterase class I)
MTESSLYESLLEPGRLSVVFQPIYELKRDSRRIHSFECLTRGPAGTNMESAAVLFEYVRRKGKEVVLDRLCLAAALRTAADLSKRSILAVNVHAATLERDREFPGFLLGVLQLHARSASSLTVEIVEHAPAWGGPRFLRTLDALKDLGVRVALDDIGLGQANYRMILECHPDYFKVDRFLVQGCHQDVRRHAILESLVQLASRFGSRVIAEGIEEPADLDAVAGLGVDLVQGFLLARPQPIAKITVCGET